MNVKRSLICASHTTVWPEGLEVQKGYDQRFSSCMIEVCLTSLPAAALLPMRDWGWLGKSHASRSCKWAYCFFPLSLLMLSINVGVAVKKEAGEGGQLSAAMDEANAVASEEQGDYLLGVINQCVTQRWPL